MFRSLRTPVYKAMFRPLEGFEDDATSGNLADYSFIEPRMFPTWETPASDQHPDHDVREGELLMKRVYEAVRNGPHWNRTLLVITYDEHGGVRVLHSCCTSSSICAVLLIQTTSSAL